MGNVMKIAALFLVLTSFVISADAQWIKQTVDTTASFRGLSVVNEKVIWASGTGGTVIRTIDGGKKWDVIQVPDAAKLDFRDIEAFDANTAYILSIGNGEASRIYKTTDGGKTWSRQFKNTNEKAFFDAIACWDKNNCVAMSDPIDGSFALINGPSQPIIGQSDSTVWLWNMRKRIPAAKEGEAAFAASGTCLITQGNNNSFLVSGGNYARVFRSQDRGQTWDVAETTFTKGTSGSGIFSIAMFDAKQGVIVGGNYEKPDEAKDNLAFSTDGGKTWKLGTGLSGYRSGVAYIDKKTIVAVGTNGSDISRDGGKTWKKEGLWPLDAKVGGFVDIVGVFPIDLNAVASKGKKAVWAVGPKGGVYRLR